MTRADPASDRPVSGHPRATSTKLVRYFGGEGLECQCCGATIDVSAPLVVHSSITPGMVLPQGVTLGKLRAALDDESWHDHESGCMPDGTR